MKILSRMIVFAFLAMVAVGCDSEPTDSEKLVGAWTLTKITDGRGDITTAFKQSVTTLRVTMNADLSDKFEVLYSAAAKAAGATDVSNVGTYVVVEASKQVQLKNMGTTLTLNYLFSEGNNNEVTFSLPAAVVNVIFNSTAYQGTVTITATKS
ncbi:MAG TPA: hypothetical protein PLO56_13500 [Rhodothermales bacterium]|nr:hypothetical protein [Rhodothermales bacterium]